MSNLQSLTKPQLIADNPGLGLKLSMLKKDIIAIIQKNALKAKTGQTRKGEY